MKGERLNKLARYLRLDVLKGFPVLEQVAGMFKPKLKEHPPKQILIEA